MTRLVIGKPRDRLVVAFDPDASQDDFLPLPENPNDPTIEIPVEVPNVRPGPDGKSAYEVAVLNGFSGDGWV